MFLNILGIVLIIYLLIGLIVCLFVGLGYNNMPENEIELMMKKSLEEAGWEFNKTNKKILIVIIYLVTLFFHPIVIISVINELGGRK